MKVKQHNLDIDSVSLFFFHFLREVIGQEAVLLQVLMPYLEIYSAP